MSEELEKIDVKLLLTKTQHAYDFILEGTHFGRGDSYISSYENKKYVYTVVAFKKWKVNEERNCLEDTNKDQIEHFYSTESYIVHVKYEIVTYDLNSGNVIQEEDSGKMKEVYFYWRGRNAPKGYSPLPKELNGEEVPVERIFQWSELPVFLRLFRGKLIIHDGNSNKRSHLYILRGTTKEEVHLLEVPNEKSSLRSKSSFILVCPREYHIYIWHGNKDRGDNKALLKNISVSLAEQAISIYNSQNNFTVTDVKEKLNDEEFILHLNGKDADYFSFESDVNSYFYSPRLFYFSSIGGNFSAFEVQYTLGSEYYDPFPFLQDHLYTAAQPALFLLDNNHELWIWQGWKDKTTTEEQMWQFEKQRKCAIQTAIDYWKQKCSTLKENIYLVAAGNEPLQFTNLFPFWVKREESGIIEFSNSKDYPNVSTLFFPINS